MNEDLWKNHEGVRRLKMQSDVAIIFSLVEKEESL